MSTYTGEFENGFKSGFGINVWSTGGRYDGQFLFNKRHGQGKMVYCNGTVYEGQWFEGKHHGFGRLTQRNIVLVGIFKNNKFIKDASNIESIESGAHGLLSQQIFESKFSRQSSGRDFLAERYSKDHSHKVDVEIKKMRRAKLKRRDSESGDFVDELIREVEDLERQQMHAFKVAKQELTADLRLKQVQDIQMNQSIERVMSDVKSSKSEHSLEEKMIQSIFLTQTNKKL